MKLSKQRIALLVFALLILAAIIISFLPKPIPVDVAEVRRGPLRVTVRDDGRTRIKERYIVSAPFGGRLRRIALKPGHRVEAGATVVAVIEPPDAQLLDPRTLAQAEARAQGAEAARRQAQALVERADANHQYAKAEVARARELYAARTVSRQELERAELAARMSEEELNAARFALQIAAYELEQVRAALVQIGPNRQPDWQFKVRSPISGEILRVFQESETVVNSGAGLVEVGDRRNLELEIDVLSTDAVQIRPGAKVWLEYWGGPRPLEARVRVVEPAAFTKISALGVEEQRVWIIADFVAPPEEWQNLGDAYRVEARIVTWESEDVLKVPAAALFRLGGRWAVFVIEEGRARSRLVEIGQRGEHEAQVLEGVTEGDQVIVHPGDRITDGIAVTAREE
jgi:HlyD family secretion protein